ncbi:MAG: pilus assembly protein PilM [Planctomycetes bacterium]|jgi:Tfp pilus assembly PilM family ATPase|nr:pilus assembly protein PilM [Planctomycetota bacterium]
MKSIGIDPGDQAVKVVELDGSYKKTRLVAFHSAPAGAPVDGGTRAEVVAAAVREALDGGMRGEVTCGHACREAVLRTIELPFKGEDAIRKVVKAEIEGEIQSQSVDDMVVDFHEIGPGTAGGTRVLVASVPKAGLRTSLAALTAQKIEPERIELDTMALWRVAHWAGAFPTAADTPAGEPKPITAVVDIGAHSVKVILVEGEQLVEMRAIRLGDAVVADEIARKAGVAVGALNDAVQRCLVTGSDQVVEIQDALPVAAGAEDKEPAVAAPLRKISVRRDEVMSAHNAYLQRLSRELTRFLAASGRSGNLRAVWATGGGAGAEGTMAMLGEVFGVEAQVLDVLGRLNHELSPEDVERFGSRLATAVGLALAPIGGPRGFQLRQEDLVLTRGFERIKFPLAIACMIGLLALFVHGSTRYLELRNLELEIGQTFVDRKNPKAPPVFYGQLNSVFGEPWFADPQNFQIELSKGKYYNHKDLLAELVQTPVHKRIRLVRDKLFTAATQKQKASGINEDISLESGLAVLVRWAEMMKAAEPQLGRFLVTRLMLDMNARSTSRRIEFTIAFRGDDFRARYAALDRAIEAEMARPDTPFEVPEKGEARLVSELFKEGKDTEVGVIGSYYRITMSVKSVFPPFGPGSGRQAIGAAEVAPVRSTEALAATAGVAKEEAR